MGDSDVQTGTVSDARSAGSEANGSQTVEILADAVDSPGVGAIGPGDSLGRYTVGALIGAGGMGRVYAATDNELGRKVALKVIRPERVASSYARARLLREAQALALFNHPNVVTVHDIGAEGENVFVAMELVDGQTLGDWLRARPRTWPAIRDVFLAAGRGLAAAHAAGIVHRDFKPHNVIVGSDRVVVVDFGLARAGADAPDEPGDPASPAGHGALHLALTLTGEPVGTPHYMAPEQRAGGAVTTKADQFAFCVALHEALLGGTPGEGAAPPGGIRVPHFAVAAITRGLSPDPEDRWPAMEVLLAALGRTFWTRRRKRLAGGAAAAATAAVAVLGFTAGQRVAKPDPCLGGDAQIATLWDDASRGRVRDAFLRTGQIYADDTFQRVDAGLRARLTGWAEAQRDNCRATHVRHEQSEAMLDLRARCLGRARVELSTFISLLQQADPGVVERAMHAVDGVADLARCSDPVALGATIAPPPATLAPAVEAMREEMARLAPLFDLGKWTQGRDAGRDLVARVRRLGYKPLLAQALAQVANVEANLEPATAIPDLYEAAQLGTEAGDDDVVAKALPLLGFALGYGKDQFEAADVVYRWAVAATARAGNAPARLSSLYGNRAVVLGRRGDHAGALALYQQLLGLETDRGGPRSLGVAWAHLSIGQELRDLGRGGEAEPHYQRATELLEQLFGSEHPRLVVLLVSRAWNLIDRFDFAAAVPLFERALGIYERSLGRDGLRVTEVLRDLSIALLGLRRLPEARAALERTIAIHHAHEPIDDRRVANAYEVLSDVAHRQGNLREAHDLIQKALAIDLAVLGAEHPLVGEIYRLAAEHLLALGRRAEARAAVTRALAIDEKARGKDHPEVGWARLTQGDVLLAEHHPREAIAAYEQSLRILEKASGADFPGLCEPLSRLAAALLDTGDARRAQALAERAVALAPNAPPDDAEVARFRLAQAHWTVGADRPGALSQARQARARLAALPLRSDELPRIDRWLSAVQ